MSLKRFFSIAQTALVSKKIDKKIVVFESDDWGSIRTPPGGIEKHFLSDGIDLLKNPYNKYDTLESPDDLRMLLDVLKDIYTRTGKKVPITLNFVMTNPDFEKIKESGFKTYHYENFTDTYKKYYHSTSALDVIFQGLAEGFFLPQFHGREHVHAPLWLEILSGGDKVYRKAFDLGFWGIGNDVYNTGKRNIQASFDIRNEKDKQFAIEAVKDGLSLFEELFKYKSESFIPNNYTWPTELNYLLKENGVKYLQGMKKQAHPKPEGIAQRKYTLRRAGHKTDAGIISLVRNTSFDPSFYSDRNSEVKKCLNEIKTAFLFHQPAVISVHRINFIGGLDIQNRTENLKLFSTLIASIVKKWPEVTFWSSVELGRNYEG